MSFQVREVVHGLEVVLSVSEFCCDERGLGVPPAELRLAMEIAMPLQVLERSRGDRAAVDFAKERKRALDAENLLTRQQIAADELFHTAVHNSDAP